MLILGIETSCDETAGAVLEIKNKQVRILANVVSSQIKIHAPFGGVVPNLAAREHEKNLPVVLARVLRSAKQKMENIDLIAVTAGPGLAPALWRGVNFANALAEKYHKPIVATNHIAGHVYSNWLPDEGTTGPLPTNNRKFFPALNLIVSGGHTQLILQRGIGKYILIGETRDDAAGEAFDKIARLLGLGYPGGPAIARAAQSGNAGAFVLPRPMENSPNYNFSFSGLKTAVLYLVRKIQVETDKQKLTKQTVADIAAAAQDAIVVVLVKKTCRAAQVYKVKTIVLSGGVAANHSLRENLLLVGKKLNLPVQLPQINYTTDNAAMIALAGYLDYQDRSRMKKSSKATSGIITADANWELV